MRTRQPVAVSIVSIAAAFLLAGCGSTGPSGGQPAAAPSGSSAQSSAAAQGGGSTAVTCDAVPASLVNSALGTDLGAPAQATGPNAVACEFKGPKSGAVDIRIQTGDDAAAFAAGRKAFAVSGQPTRDYAGFGDEAYTSTQHMPLGLPAINTLVARQGAVEILVASPASLTAERALEQRLFAKLG